MTVRLFGSKKGFTLIELLVVIAVLGVLAVVVLLAINPVQQLARARDTGRKSTVAQLGHAMEAYGTTHNGTYITDANTWVTALVTAGEIATAPVNPNYSTLTYGGCTAANNQGGYCYISSDAAGTAPVVVYARLESLSATSLCTDPAAPVAWFTYSSGNGRAGTVCTGDAATEPAPGVQTFVD